MKLIVTDYEYCSEVSVRDAGGINLHTYTFDDHKQARAFCSGFTCARLVANAVVQSLPMDYVVQKVPATLPVPEGQGVKEETIGQQLSHQ